MCWCLIVCPASERTLGLDLRTGYNKEQDESRLVFLNIVCMAT